LLLDEAALDTGEPLALTQCNTLGPIQLRYGLKHAPYSSFETAEWF
tara:strand:+ start:155 stop:292 length:138 start_codon:yes stop_codon:yes gene_type:complete